MEGTRELSQVSFIRSLITFLRSLLSWPNHLPRHHLQIPSHWRLGFNVWILLGTQTVSLQQFQTDSMFLWALLHLNWEKLKAGGEGDDRRLDGWMASLLDGHEFEQALGVSDGQKSLACCNPWGCKELNMTEQLNWTEHLNLKELPNQRPHKLNKNGPFLAEGRSSPTPEAYKEKLRVHESGMLGECSHINRAWSRWPLRSIPVLLVQASCYQLEPTASPLTPLPALQLLQKRSNHC